MDDESEVFVSGSVTAADAESWFGKSGRRSARGRMGSIYFL